MSQQQICPVCQNTSLCFKSSLNKQTGFINYSLFECLNCHTQFWNPLEHPGGKYYENENFSIYNDFHSNRGSNLVFKDVRFVKFLKEFENKSNQRILEIGCSDGLLLSHLASLNNEVWGVDVDSIATDIAKSRGLKNIYCKSLEDFIVDCKKESIVFDYILAFDVIEHLTDPTMVIRKLESLLSDQGRMIGTVPNRNRWFANLVDTDFPPHHFYRFNTDSLSYLLNSCELKVSKIHIFDYGQTLRTVALSLSANLRKAKKVNNDNTIQAENKDFPPANNSNDSKTAFSLKTISISIMKYLSVIFEYPFNKGYKIYFQATKKNSIS